MYSVCRKIVERMKARDYFIYDDYENKFLHILRCLYSLAGVYNRSLIDSD